MFFFIGVWGGPRKRYAAMKFIIYTTSGSVVMLLGFIALYFSLPASSATFDLMGIWQIMKGNTGISETVKLLITGAVFFGFAVKLPVVPLHTWLPDAHVEAPAPISVLLAGLLLKMGGYGFIRISLTIFPDITNVISPVYIALGLVSIVYAGVVATMQEDLKRLIELTSINHMGYVLVGAYTALPIGVAGAVFQMFNHACAIGLLFLLSGVLHENAGTRMVSQLKGLRVGMPLTSALLAVGSFAAIGMPGLSNFLSEFMVITSAIQFSWVLVIIVLGPAITAGYFMWMMNRVIFSQPAVDSKMHESPRLDLLILACFLIPVFVLGVYPGPMLDKITPAVQFLFGNILGH
jgi:NADH-quinone oxidoreductase subunit M